MNDFSGLLVFKIADLEFCNDLTEITSIINVKEIKKKSSKIKLNSGHLFFENQIIPVLDLIQIFGKRNKPIESEDLRLLLLEKNDKTFGLIVEKIIEILNMDFRMKSVLKFTSIDDEKFFQGVFRFDNRSLHLLDINKIFSTQQAYN
jgi:chemotaxis signal transduction protein